MFFNQKMDACQDLNLFFQKGHSFSGEPSILLAFWSVVVLKGSQFSLQMLELHDLLGYGGAFTTFGPRKTDGTMKALSPKQYLYII